MSHCRVDYADVMLMSVIEKGNLCSSSTTETDFNSYSTKPSTMGSCNCYLGEIIFVMNGVI